MNADYSKLKALADLLATKGKVVSKSIAEGKGYIRIEHTGTSDGIADFIDSKAGSLYSIQNVESGKITMAIK